MGEVRIL